LQVTQSIEKSNGKGHLPAGAMDRRLKVLYVSFIPPTPAMGTAMTFYRHFIERNDFDIKVITNLNPFPFDSVPYEPVLFNPSRLTFRLFRTRLLPWVYGLHSLITHGRIPSSVWKAAKDFKPDFVFTVVAGWDYSILVAQRMARHLKVPLVVSFNDWFNYGWFPSHPLYHRRIEESFRRLYHECDLAFCTSEGMREALGPHPNAHVLYPTGGSMPDSVGPFEPYTGGTRPFVIGFGGSLAEWYGQMLERLVSAAQTQSAPVEFRFYGSNPNWTPDFAARARGQNIFRGHLPFEQLQREMSQVDALILPMGFEERCAFAERTSFKTKFLDYLSYQKPIFVWGPEYCTAVRVAREFDSAEICTDPKATAILERILAVRSSPPRQVALVQNARRMYEDRFKPDKIHAGFLGQCRQLIMNRSAK